MWHGGLKLLLTAVPGIVDVDAQVVDAFAFVYSGEERQEETDKLFFGNQVGIQLGLVGAHVCHGFAHLLRRGAGGKDGDIGLQAFLLFYI